MKSKNMSCVIKKSLFLLVLSIVCNSTLSDITEANASEVFLPYLIGESVEFMPPWLYFKIAMVLLSQSVIDSLSPEELILHLRKHKDALKLYGDGDTTMDLLFSEENDYKLWNMSLKHKWKQIISNSTSGESNKQYIVGYFHYLVSKLDIIVEFINEIATSPKQYCEDYDENEHWLCKDALYAMLSLRGFNSKTEIDEMKGYNAFKYCYLYYTHDDFSIDKIFPKLDSRDDNQSNITRQSKKVKSWVSRGKNLAESSNSRSSGVNQDKSVQESQIDIMVQYYEHMYYVSTQIAKHNENKGLKLIPTVEEYCIDLRNKEKH